MPLMLLRVRIGAGVAAARTARFSTSLHHQQSGQTECNKMSGSYVRDRVAFNAC
jgi:hypothetical protein